MSGGHQMLLALGGANVPSSGILSIVRDVRIAPAVATASFTLHTDGTITKVGNATLGLNNWYLPTTGAVGNFFWCRLVNLTAGIALNVGGLVYGTIYQLNVNRQFGYTQATGIRTADVRLEIATDAGMANIISNSTFMLEAVSEP